MTFPESLLYTLRELREYKALSQRDVSRQLNVTQAYYCGIENGKRRPNIDVLHDLAVVYDASMDFIYHCYQRQKITIYVPDYALQYGMRKAKEKDIQLITTYKK